MCADIIVKKPSGQITRGKTARNRLRRIDNFLMMYTPELFSRCVSEKLFYVDLGYGREPITTLETRQLLAEKKYQIPILGVEIDPERIEQAIVYSDKDLKFRLGGFNVPLYSGEKVGIIRAFNVLRQYEEQDYWCAVEEMMSVLEPGGILIEGTSNVFGSIWTANVFRKLGGSGIGISWEAMVFSTNFHNGFDITAFQTVLPKNLIHRMVAGESIYEFFQCWHQSAGFSRSYADFGLKNWFMKSVEGLSGCGYRIDKRKRYLRRGYLVWKQPDIESV